MGLTTAPMLKVPIAHVSHASPLRKAILTALFLPVVAIVLVTLALLGSLLVLPKLARGIRRLFRRGPA